MAKIEQLPLLDITTDISYQEFSNKLAEAGVTIDRDSKKSMHDLYEEFRMGECWFEFNEQKEIVRHARVVEINVEYTSSNGHRYRLKENGRYTLPHGSTPEEFFAGNAQPVKTQFRDVNVAVVGKVGKGADGLVEDDAVCARREFLEELIMSNPYYKSVGLGAVE